LKARLALGFLHGVASLLISASLCCLSCCWA